MIGCVLQYGRSSQFCRRSCSSQGQVPNRHNYILFLKSLIDSTSYFQASTSKATGLDIGTGSSCIYPLLGAVQCGWSFYATDIDEKNLDFAARNFKANNLSDRITLLCRKPEDDLIPELDGPITFCMTNPPFYTSQAQLEASASAKHDGPASVCTGAPVEMVTEGGEVAFVARILNESLRRKDDVQWYTAMLGFLSSVSHIVHLMRRGGITNWAVSELDQGSKTKRWVLAWSFGAMRPADHVCRGVSNKGLPLPPPTEATISPNKGHMQTQTLISGLQEAIAQLDLLSWTWDSETSEGTGRAPGNVWNRNWRRKKKALEAEGKQMTHSQDDVFGFKVTVTEEDGALAVHCRWLEGHAFVTFESFQGFIKTTLNRLVSDAGAQ